MTKRYFAKNIISLLLFAILLSTSMYFSMYVSANNELSEEKLQEIYDGFIKRRDADMRRVQGRLLRIDNSSSSTLTATISNFAIKAFWFNEQIETANNALQRLANFFIENREARNDGHSLYWQSDLICRVVEFYGKNGSIDHGRLDHETESLLLEMMWLFANEHSRVDSLNEVYQFYADWQTKYRGTGAPMPISANVKNTETWDII